MSVSKTTLLSTLKKFRQTSDPRYAVTVEKLATATAGYAHSYAVKQNGVQVGATIDIPKDFLVKSATVETVTTANTPVTGYTVGQKYLDFVVNSIDNDATASHIYLLVEDLVDVYNEGNGIELGPNNTFSVKINSSNANGLSVDSNGLALGLATASTDSVGGSNGAMSAIDKEKLDILVETSNETISDAEIAALFADE
jgi:hypothetical protein